MTLPITTTGIYRMKASFDVKESGGSIIESGYVFEFDYVIECWDEY